MGVTIAAWAYSYVPRGTLTIPYPAEPAWRIPVMWVGVMVGAAGLFLIVAPWIRKLILWCRGETEEISVTITRTKRKTGGVTRARGDGSVETEAHVQ